MIDRQKLRDFAKNFLVVLAWIAALCLAILLLVGAFVIHPVIGVLAVVIYLAVFIAVAMTL